MKHWVLPTLLFFLSLTVSAQINKLEVDISGVSPLCHTNSGVPTGEINVTVIGGTLGYSYNWTSPNGCCLNPTSEDQSA